MYFSKGENYATYERIDYARARSSTSMFCVLCWSDLLTNQSYDCFVLTANKKHRPEHYCTCVPTGEGLFDFDCFNRLLSVLCVHPLLYQAS